jgi:succinate dehydrogenase / fumarate reductase, cytochrome b subunit
MHLFTLLFKSSIGKKFWMAVTGLVLFAFVVAHLAANLQIFAHPENINTYAYFLESLGGGLWAARFLLLLAVGIHIWMAVSLTIHNREARPVPYELRKAVQASYAARTMRLSGFIVLAFILFHLAHYTLRVTHPEYNELTYTHDLHEKALIDTKQRWSLRPEQSPKTS